MKTHTVTTFLAALAAAMLVEVIACQPHAGEPSLAHEQGASRQADESDQEPLRISGPTMGSHYLAIIESPGATDAMELKMAIESVFAVVNRQMSTWDPESEISQFNRTDSTEWFPIGREFAVVTAEAGRLHQLTGGVLDPTLAPLIDAWGFGVRKQPMVPDDATIQSALAKVGMLHIEVRLDPPAIRRKIVGVTLNLSSLAPGFAADAVRRLLIDRGLKSHVVDVGGENAAGLSKPNGDGWRLGVESPLGGLHKVLEVTELSLATSGDYRNFHKINGRLYSHILDPRTGRPVENPPACVSVAHSSCMTADGLATAMMVLGSVEGMKLAESHDLDVMFLDVTDRGSITETSRGLFADVEAE